MITGDVNRHPRRWMDRSTRVRVIEGWHPSQPDRLGYNLMVDGDWVGTFESLDSAATQAATRLGTGPRRITRRQVELLPCIHPANG